jgi:predicted RNase H-like nuclease
VAGVDGCRGAWLVVRRPLDPGVDPTAELVDDLGPLVADLRNGDLAAVAVDMPIGLLDHHPRTCDVEARRLLGPRRSSVFPTPVRAALGAMDYDEARRRSRAAAGVAPSRQAFNLLPAIRHLDALVVPDDQDRLVEAHPELAFARLAGAPLADPKRTIAGRTGRRRLLVAEDPGLEALLDRSGLPPVDLLDAGVLTVTARRVVAGTERRLGDQRDPAGRRAEVVW